MKVRAWTRYRGMADMPLGFDDSHPSRDLFRGIARVASSSVLPSLASPPAAGSSGGVIHGRPSVLCCRCGSEDVTVQNDRGAFCSEHEIEAMRWPA